MGKRKRKIWSVKAELIAKAKEAMLSAVQIFNNPNISFKSESFIVLSNIAWTYLLHAYYKSKDIDFAYYKIVNSRKKYDKTQRGTVKYWELEKCLNDAGNPIDEISKTNLLFLIGLRHEIEHQMTTRIDDYLSARFQACCINFNFYIKKLFGAEFGIDRHLSISLQFSSISDNQQTQLRKISDLPKNIGSFINDFDSSLPEDRFNDSRYSYRVLYIPKTANRKGQADKVIEFIPADSPEAQGLNKEYVVIKDRERPKYLASEVVRQMKQKGYVKFGMYQHTCIWKKVDAKNSSNGYGVEVAKTWYWYDKWLEFVEQYCVQYQEDYK